MRAARTRAFSVVSIISLITALVSPFVLLGLHVTPRALLGVALLGSAFAVLSIGHFLVERVWWKQLVLALSNAPLLYAWWVAAAAMWYFAPGLLGAAVFGGILCIPAALVLLALRWERRAESHAT